MSLLYHPDKLGDRSEEEQAAGNAMFLKVSAAYAVLSDEGSRRKYDIWVRGGRKRRPEPGDDMGPMPDYYRDDSVRDVQDTPAAWFGLLLTLVISAGLPLMLSMQGKHSKKRRPPSAHSFAFPAGKAEVLAPHVPRKVRRGEREQRDASARCTPATADIVAVTTTEDTGVHAQENSVAAARSITKVSGPWSPEEDAELAKAIARVPGGSDEHDDDRGQEQRVGPDGGLAQACHRYRPRERFLETRHLASIVVGEFGEGASPHGSASFPRGHPPNRARNRCHAAIVFPSSMEPSRIAASMAPGVMGTTSISSPGS